MAATELRLVFQAHQLHMQAVAVVDQTTELRVNLKELGELAVAATAEMEMLFQELAQTL
jgi:hypothetical protein